MTIRPVITVPDPRLRQISKAVAKVDDDLRVLLDDMLETMYDAPGIGLAAIQIGVPKRCIVIDISHRAPEDGKEPLPPEPIYLVNPEIISVSDEIAEYEEGCLSVPEYYEMVERPAHCRVRYLDYHGKEQEMDCDDLLATCVQHEFEHLNGGLFIDHISKLKRDRIMRKFVKAQRAREKGAA